MEKINGKVKDGMTLNQVLGRRDNVAGITSVLDYQMEISKMDIDQLYRHGMNEFKIVPTRSKNARQSFEKKCIAAFRKATNQRQDEYTPIKKLTKKKAAELQKILDKVK